MPIGRVETRLSWFDLIVWVVGFSLVVIVGKSSDTKKSDFVRLIAVAHLAVSGESVSTSDLTLLQGALQSNDGLVVRLASEGLTSEQITALKEGKYRVEPAK